ncbi:uncharacterized protein DUF4199 [Algoriphagus ratkowskyi]|uniref:DUF4199 domain-containing protein n=1 Tax=Algoriphagus ratkowskyi TaxID=57028 RepID=A0A2W7RCC4_9BACT|nr:DUF4199 domain-containing protein [Algoriphagus ratkowskyi]PZX51809.1 uncharacterized protein DUF4199 [Algoriphagus ratkowskyi]TXD76053.1 DUF4199 domain-containing protein [Algoriphagus ratkowskyi]
MFKYFSTSYKFGGFAGVLSILAFITLSFLYSDPTNLNLIFGYAITPIAIFLAVKFYRDYSNEGNLSFSEGMSVGFVAYMLEAIVSLAGIWLILIVHPDLFDRIKTSKLNVLGASKDTIIAQVGEGSFDLTLVSINNMIPWDIALNDALWKIIPGLFFTIIISIILRKNPN